MEQDKTLKEILQNSAAKPAAGFTNAVMQQVHQQALAQTPYQPLVPAKAKKIFLLVFTALVAAITVLCLGMGLPYFKMDTYLQHIAIPKLDYQTIISSILIFWALFIANALLQKQHRLKKGAA